MSITRETAYIISGVIAIVFIILIIKSFKKAKSKMYNKDFDARIKLDDISLSPAQIDIKKKYGEPLEIRTQDSIDNIISIWVYPEKIISFNQDGSLRKTLN